MKVGFTRTRAGLQAAQRAALGTFLLMDLSERVTEFVHGSCQGADVQAARLARHIFDAGCRIVARPGPDGDPCRDESGVDDETMPGKNHFARNRDIVLATELLVACPPCKPMPPSGGTLYTVKFARKQKRPLVIIWPDGSIDDERRFEHAQA